MKYPEHVENVITEIISAFKEDRMMECHWIDLDRLRRFNFERNANAVYGMTVNKNTGKWEKVQLTPPFLSTWTVAKGFPRREKSNEKELTKQ